MKKVLIIGGTHGLGSAILEELKLSVEHIYVVGKTQKTDNDNITFIQENLINQDFEFLTKIPDNIDTVIITSGICRIDKFQNFTLNDIDNFFKTNTLTVIKTIHNFYDKLLNDDFNFCVISSISAHIVSPLLALYGSTKSAISSFIESINIELEKQNSKNRILDVSPGYMKGTSLYGEKTDISLLSDLAKEIITRMENKETFFLPNSEVYNKVLNDYKENPEQFGLNSYDYKITNKRPQKKPIIGYMSGSFDLFHIGHLNIIKQAKRYCDFLIVGVHKDGKHKNKELVIDFEDRKEIVRNIKYVDMVIDALPEDSDAYELYHISKLFVGTDYKDSEKFNRYEEYFKEKDVEIIYIPYTQKCSSTKLREKLNNF